MSYEDISIAGHKLELKPEFDALVKLEAELGSLFHFVERAGEGDLKLSEIVAMIDHLWQREIEIDRAAIGDAVASIGLSKLMPIVRKALGDILQGRR